MLKKIGNITLALWLILITSGILVNKHFSGHFHYSSALYIEAESCCDSDESSCKIGVCASENNEPTCCREDQTRTSGFNNFKFEKENCCTETATFFQLAQVYFPVQQKENFTVPIFLAPVSEITNNLSLISASKDYKQTNHPPPKLYQSPIYIIVSSFLC